jgi:uncharacterized membrane protein
MLYRALLLVHLLGVAAFLSNAVAALFWKARADRGRDPAVVAHTFRTLVAGDRWITPIATAAIVITGIGAALVAGVPMLRTGWLLWSIVSFAGSGAVFGWERYESEARRWSRWAHVSLLLAFLAMALMTLKPVLPAL